MAWLDGYYTLPHTSTLTTSPMPWSSLQERTRYRFAPAVMLGVLNTWIIIEFKRISRRRLLLSQGMSCEVSAIPSQSYFEGNVNSTVVNPSPTNGQAEKETEQAGPTTPPGSGDPPANKNPTAATNVTSTHTATSFNDGFVVEKEVTKMDSPTLNNNGHVVGGKCPLPEGVSSPVVNGYRPVFAGEEINGCKKSSVPCATRSAEEKEKEAIMLSTINVASEFVLVLSVVQCSLVLNYHIHQCLSDDIFDNFAHQFINH